MTLTPYSSMAKTILIVDDEPDILDLLQFNLETEGYHVLRAADGDQAVGLARAEIPDLIILDIMLPGKGGWEVIRELKMAADTLLNEIWGYDVVVIDRTIDVHIRRIREKLGAGHAHRIETLKGVGYRFKIDE